jgi:tetratricopeptide (TPR) repeat protein
MPMNSLADAMTAMDTKNFRGALEVLERLAPTDHEGQATVLFYIGWCRETLGDEDTENIASCYERAALLAQDAMLAGNALFRAGWVLLGADEQQLADSCFARSTDRLSAAGFNNALYCHAAFWQAAGWERSGRYLDAVERYREVATLDDSLRAECHYRQIQCLLSVGALEDALSVCEEAEEWLGQDSQARSAELRRLIAQERNTLRAAMGAA